MRTQFYQAEVRALAGLVPDGGFRGESISLLFPVSRHSLLFIPDIALQLLTSQASLSSEDTCDYIWSPLE